MLNGKMAIGLALTLTLLTISGCTNFGARQVPADQFDYNRAIARSMQDQMLLNVVRLRYFEAPVFLAVGSVLTQYAWQGSIGVGGQEGFSIGGGVQAPSFISGAATAQYVERPTITYLPIEGDDFSRRMLTPLPLDFVFALQEAGYATDLLFRAGISRGCEPSTASIAEAMVATYHDASQRGSAPPKGPGDRDAFAGRQ